MRVIADHVRAVAFAIADGQLPSNTGAGYVIRRILRRAVRYGYTFLDKKEAFVFELVEVLTEQFAGVFPELIKQKELVSKVIQEEETAFLRTLESGLKRLDQLMTDQTSKTISDGKTVFELYDTFGFPTDLTGLIARENGFTIDEAGFTAEMQKQKDRSRKASASQTGDWTELQPHEGSSFTGYDSLQEKARLTRYRTVKTKDKEINQFVLDRTPFYGESGGQIGDTGLLTLSNGKKIPVIDTKKERPDCSLYQN